MLPKSRFLSLFQIFAQRSSIIAQYMVYLFPAWYCLDILSHAVRGCDFQPLCRLETMVTNMPGAVVLPVDTAVVDRVCAGRIGLQCVLFTLK